MPNFKDKRVASDIHRLLSEILKTVKDPKVKKECLSIVRVEVSKDLSYAKVFISSLGEAKATKEAVEGLEHSMGYIRSMLAKSLTIRKCPKLQFIADDSIAYAARLEKMILDIKKD